MYTGPSNVFSALAELPPLVTVSSGPVRPGAGPGHHHREQVADVEATPTQLQSTSGAMSLTESVTV